MPVESLMEYERIWIEGLNRGDVSVADDVFSPACVIHITGVAAPIRGLRPWKELVGGLLGAAPPTGKPIAIDGLIVDHVEDGRVLERWEQWDQSLMLQQLGVA